MRRCWPPRADEFRPDSEEEAGGESEEASDDSDVDEEDDEDDDEDEEEYEEDSEEEAGMSWEDLEKEAIRCARPLRQAAGSRVSRCMLRRLHMRISSCSMCCSARACTCRCAAGRLPAARSPQRDHGGSLPSGTQGVQKPPA